jgi:tRNA nucleotidyltransferase (CCA-adding enzyme)
MTTNKADIEKHVLKQITPTPKDRQQLETVIKKLVNDVEKEITKQNLPITCELVGSTAKDTYLKNNLDIDLFLLFPTTMQWEKLTEHGLAIGRSLLKNTEECYAEHPYLRGDYQSYKTEIVPCYQIESASQKLSAVDRTPLHTKYIKEHLVESQKKEVRLFKQFLTGIGCYGAEAEVEGFSGYLCELLILKYDTVHNLLHHAQQWHYGEVLSLNRGEFPVFDTPLVFIDPVDVTRNVASALSKETYDLFVTACNAYLEKPRITFFFPNEITPWSLDKIKKATKQLHLIGLKFTKPNIISENLYPQVRKAVRSVTDVCERYDFKLDDVHYYIDESAVYIILFPQERKLPKTKVHMGPPVHRKKNAEEFTKKWTHDSRMIQKPFKKDNRWYVEITREYTDIIDLLNDHVNTLSLGKHIDEIVQKDFSIVEHNELIQNNLRIFWTAYLDKKMTWER